MSEHDIEVCEKCGYAKDYCKCNKETPTKDKMVVEIKMTEEMKRLSEENATLKALEGFEQMKKAISEHYSDPDILKCATPKELSQKIAEDQALTETEKKSNPPKGSRAPTGKATNPPSNQGLEFGSQIEMIDQLYDKAYLHPGKYTPEQVADSKRKIDDLWFSTLSGPSWRELRESGVREVQKHRISTCQNCGRTLFEDVTGTRCTNPDCNYDPVEKKKVDKTRTYRGA